MNATRVCAVLLLLGAVVAPGSGAFAAEADKSTEEGSFRALRFPRSMSSANISGISFSKKQPVDFNTLLVLDAGLFPADAMVIVWLPELTHFAM